MTLLRMDGLDRAEARATERAPDGRRLARFRWAWSDGAGWLMPRVPKPDGVCLAVPLEIPQGGGRRFAYAIAHAVRQDLWRALAGTRGFWPLVRVTPSDDKISIIAGGMLPGPLPGVERRIADLATPRRLRLWTGFAAATTRVTGERCSTRS